MLDSMRTCVAPMPLMWTVITEYCRMGSRVFCVSTGYLEEWESMLDSMHASLYMLLPPLVEGDAGRLGDC